MPSIRSSLRTIAIVVTLSASASGIALPVLASPIPFVPRTSIWKFFAGPAVPAPDWASPGFADSLWNSGSGPLGYGESYIATPVPFGGDPANAWISCYFRHQFFLGEDVSSISSLVLGLDYDDGIVVYLNGTEVVRRSMPAGPVAWNTLAYDHEALNTYEQIDLASAIPLLAGNALNTLAVEVHQRAQNSTDLVMDVELLTATTPNLAVTRGPYVQNATPSAVTLRWRTNVPTRSRVLYGAKPMEFSGVADDFAMTTEHEVRVTGLAPGSEWYYAVGDLGFPVAGNDDSTRFRTNPAPGESSPVRMWVIGDAGWGSPAQQQVRTAYETYSAGRRTDLWLMLGDNAYWTGLDLEYQAGVFDMYRGLLRSACVWPTRGNHDVLHAGTANDYYDHFTLPSAGEAGGVASGTEAYYSFDYGNIHLVCLDSEGSDLAVDGAMLTWLRQDLAATESPWIMAYWHHPPYSRGSHNSDNELDSFAKMGNMRRNVLPILDSAGVDLVLTGHSHSYERSFLLNGHYQASNTLLPEMIKDGRAGRMGVDGPYTKELEPFQGTVYVVDGSSGTTSGGTLDHPVMVESLNTLGSLVIDIAGMRLDAHFVDAAGAARDSFTIVKGGPLAAGDETHLPTTLSLAPVQPNPGTGGFRFQCTLPRTGRVRLQIVDAAGRLIAPLFDRDLQAGRHPISWDGRDASGTPAPSGVYFAVLRFEGERRAAKVVLDR